MKLFNFKHRNIFKTLILFTSYVNIHVYGAVIPKSPCQSIFKYKTREGTGEVYGFVKFKNDLTGDYQLEIRLSIAKRNSASFTIQRIPSEEEIQCGRDIEYEIIFPESFGELIPLITYVEFNEKIYCTGKEEKDVDGRGTTLLTEWDGFVTNVDEKLCQDTKKLTKDTTNRSGVNDDNEDDDKENDDPKTKRDSCGTLEEIYIGKSPTGRAHFPWLVTINYPYTNNSGYLCSGTLISKTHIVTIANCVKNLDKHIATVRLGRNNKKEIVPSVATTVRKIKSVTVHPEFVANAYNIAIVELDQPVEYSDLIRPICLWTGSDKIAELVSKQSTVIGWEADSTPKKITMTIVSENECLESNELFYLVLDPTSFCAGNRVDCIVNSIGGSLMLKRDDGRYYLRGMTSGVFVDKERQCDGISHNMFTDVAKFGDWISSIIKIK